MTTTNPPPQETVRVAHVWKSYGRTRALSDVTFAAYRGDVYGLLGENGAGKSTLVKCLSGTEAIDRGEMWIDGKRFSPRGVSHANACGVSTAFQELSFISSLSVAYNLSLPNLPTYPSGSIMRRELRSRTAELLHRYESDDVSPDDRLDSLPLATRQRLEIIRACSRNPRVLLLDEPTAALSDREWVFKLVGDLSAHGVTVIYITHKIDEVRRLCSKALILRNGQAAFDGRVDSLADQDIFQYMAGRPTKLATRKNFVSTADGDRKVMLDVRRLSVRGMKNVNISVRAGEIVGVVALEGQGQFALFRALSGLLPSKCDYFSIDGFATSQPLNRRRLLSAGLVYVPAERKSDAIFARMTTTANISITTLRAVSRYGIIASGLERQRTERLAGLVNLSRDRLGINISGLSGGNQQKAILARALSGRAKCMLLFDPTRGVDMGAKQNIYDAMTNFVSHGMSILLYSTDLDELVALCDRCIVMYDGCITMRAERSQFDKGRLLAFAHGMSG